MIHTMHIPELTTVTDDGHAASFAVEPLHRGFGVTLGNSLRRVLLSSLSGAAVTSFAVDGVSHEFSTIDGVKEDVVTITLNLKRLRFRVYSDEPQTLRIGKKGKGPVTATDIATSADVEVINQDQHILTLDDDKTKFEMTLRVEKGRGYYPVEDRNETESEVGMIAIDALFSPVARVRYKVENTRVGRVTDLDRLVIDIETDGTLEAREALQQAAAILVEQFTVVAGDAAPSATGNEGNDASESDDEPAEINFSVEDLTLSPRTTNALQNNDIHTVRDLLELSDSDLKGLKGFGAKAYDEVREKLKELELR